VKRAGWTLIEVMCSMVLLTAAVAVGAGVFGDALRAVPRSARAVEAGRQLADALRQMRRDVDAAVGFAPADDALLIRRRDGVVGYAVADGQVTRFRVTPAGRRTERTWSAPGGRMDWRFRPGAVEVRTWIELARPDRQPLTRLANARVLFLPPGGEDRP